MPVYKGFRFSLGAGRQTDGFTRGSTRGPSGPKKIGNISRVKHLTNSTSESSLANITQSVSDQGKAIIGIGSDKVLFINH